MRKKQLQHPTLQYGKKKRFLKDLMRVSAISPNSSIPFQRDMASRMLHGGGQMVWAARSKVTLLLNK